MEDGVAVFLPAAGGFDGTMINDFGSCCYYWSSSNTNVIVTTYAYAVGVDNSILVCNYVYKHYGMYVRLVRPVDN